MTSNEAGLEEGERCLCDNCAWVGPQNALGCELHEIPHLSERLDPGGEIPAGECPECGALAYVIQDGVQVRPVEKPSTAVSERLQLTFSAGESGWF